MKNPMLRRKRSPQGPDGEEWRLEREICDLLVERVRDYAIFILDPEGHIRSWNEGAQRIKGYTRDEILGKPMSTFYTPEDIAAGRPAKLLNIARAEGRVEDEGWRVRKNGERFWADVVITALRGDDGKLKGFGKVTRDLTERKKTEDALGELSGKLLKVQDEERRRIASELHDNTSPLLTSLVSKLYQTRQRAPEDDAVHRAIDESLALAETTSNMVRTVSWLLHPSELDEGGLLPSLRTYFGAFTRLSGVPVDVQLPDLMPRLPAEYERVLYRLAQDWLEHRQQEGLRSARARLTMTTEKVNLRMQGEPVMPARATGQLGVLMTAHRERIRQLGGRLDLDGWNSGFSATLQLRSPEPAAQ
jgi:PAS domain S-box-containing protein